jgi:hypothetical protein
MARSRYEALVRHVRPDAEAVAAALVGARMLDAAGGAAWVARWEAVWAANLAGCGADGMCRIQLS